MDKTGIFRFFKVFRPEHPPKDSRFSTAEEAAQAWADIYREKSVYIEYGALLYRNKKGGYRYGETYEGYRSNTVPGFILGYCRGLCRPGMKIAGFIHSHPVPPPGYTSSFASGPDLFLLKLPFIRYLYIVPGENRELLLYKKKINKRRKKHASF